MDEKERNLIGVHSNGNTLYSIPVVNHQYKGVGFYWYRSGLRENMNTYKSSVHNGIEVEFNYGEKVSLWH